MFGLRQRLTRLSCVLALLVCSSPTLAVELIRDINQQSSSANSSIRAPVEVGSLVFFVHDDGSHGRELWATDGTAAGTRLVRDINPGLPDGEIYSITAFNGAAYFWANDGTNGMELWRSDGSTAGTAIVVNIGPGSAGFGGPYTVERPIVTFNGAMYFSANDGTTGIELWRSDGTAAGTYRLTDIQPGAGDSEPRNFAQLGARLFFNAGNPPGPTLWSTDGTMAGTRRVTTTPADGIVQSVQEAFIVGDVAFTAGWDPIHGGELWRVSSDGTASMVADLNTFPANPAISDGKTGGSNPTSVIPFGDGVLFVAEIQVLVNGVVVTQTSLYRVGVSGATITRFFEWPMFMPVSRLATVAGRTLFFTQASDYTEIWSTDGTLEGTVRVRPNGYPLLTSNTSTALIHGDGEVFFYARSGEGSTLRGLWRSDGTPEGTREYVSFPQPFIGTELVRWNGRFYFPTGRNSDSAGGELWTTDGTASGTQRVVDINPGPNHSDPSQLTVVLGKLFFNADDGVHGREPWMSDGTSAGTFALGDLSLPTRTGDGGPNRLTRFGDGVLFLANDGIAGQELWYSDGTSAGTQLVKDIYPGPTTPGISRPQALANFVLFMADDGTAGRELWRSDGTTSGTVRVADIAAGPASGDPFFNDAANTALNGVAYFSADDGVHGKELWRSDGTAAGTYMLTELTPGNDPSRITPLGVANGKFIFTHKDAEHGKLWATDGTASGTVTINDEVDTFLSGVTFGNYLYFAGESGINETYASQLWRTDGTSAGTERVAVPDVTSIYPYQMRAIHAGLVIHGCAGSACALYITDGTPSGMRKLSDARPSGDYVGNESQLFYLSSVGGQQQIYRTDGTVAGTRPLLPGFDFGGPIVGLGSWFQGWLFFTVNESGRGPVIWRTNGTAAGTRRFADMDPGTDPYNRPYDHFVLGSKLLFAGFRPDVGSELFAISADVPNAEDDSAQGAFNAVVTANVLDNDTAFTGALNPGSLEIIVAPRFGTASLNATTGAITYTPQTGFSGADSLVYQVRDDQSRLSNSAALWVTIAANAGTGPGTAPAGTPINPPVSNPPGAPPASGGTGGSGGGGGGSLDWLSLMFLSMLAINCGRRKSVRRSSCPARG